jgi:hypothetical protein
MVLPPLVQHGVDHEAVTVKPHESNLAAALPAGQVKTKSFDHVAVVLFEVLKPRLLDPTERVGLCRQNPGMIHQGCPSAVRQDDGFRRKKDQCVFVAYVEQRRIGVARGDHVEQAPDLLGGGDAGVSA